MAIGAAATFVGQGVKAAVLIGGQLALTRLLSPGDFGLVAMVAPVLALVQVFADLGLSQAIIQRAQINQAQLTSLFWRTLVITCGLSAAVALTSPAIAWAYGEARVIPLTAALAILIVISGMTMQQSAILARNFRFGCLALVDSLAPAAAVAAALGAAIAGGGVWSLIVLQLVQSTVTLMLTWAFSPWRPSPPKIDGSDLELMRLGGHQAGFNLSQFLTTSVDNILIGLVNGKVALGFYDRAYIVVTQPAGMLLLPLNRFAIPVLSRLTANPDRYRAIHSAMLQTGIFLVAPGMLFGALFADQLIPLALGKDWAAVVPIFRWLCMGALASPVYASAAWLFVSQGLGARQLKFGVAVAMLNILSFGIGIFWGPVGVAACSAICFTLIQAPLICWAATREGPVRFIDVADALAPMFAGGFAVVVVGNYALTTLSRSAWSLIGCGLAAYILYLLTTLLFPQFRTATRNLYMLLGVQSDLTALTLQPDGRTPHTVARKRQSRARL